MHNSLEDLHESNVHMLIVGSLLFMGRSALLWDDKKSTCASFSLDEMQLAGFEIKHAPTTVAVADCETIYLE